MGQRWQRRKRTHIAVLAVYLVLAVAATWPLVRHLGSHVPGSYTWAFDEYTFVWNSWWFRYALLDLGQNPLYSTHTFYPLGISLVLYTYNLFNALISLPLQPFLSLPTISNLSFLLATVLSGYGAFLLIGYLLRQVGTAAGHERERAGPEQGTEDGNRSSLALVSAFLGGLIYAFGSYRMVYAAMGHYDMWSTGWIPFFALYLVRTVRQPGWRNAMMAGLFLFLAMLAEMIFGVFLAMLALILLAFLLGRQARRQIAGGWPALAKRLVVLVLVAGVLYAPLLVPILREMFGGYELAGWGDAEKLSVDLVGLVTPTALHPLGGEWVTTLRQTLEGTARFRDVNTVFLGWAALALAVAGTIRYRRQLAAWAASFLVFVSFSLGPLLQVNGRSTFDLDGLLVNVPLPFIALHYLPVVKANRVPNRFSVVLMLALAVLAAFGAYWVLSKLAGRRWQATRWFVAPAAVLLAALLLFEHWSVPLPLTDARIPPVYEQVAAEQGDFAILQLPMGWRNSFGVQGAESTQTQYYQTYHHKRLLSGNISRNPPFKFEYFARQPILESLIALETYEQVDAERRAADRAVADEFVAFYDIRYVVVAPGVPGRPPYVDTRDEAVAYVEEVLPLTKVTDRDGWLLYRVEQPAQAAGYAVDLGSSDTLALQALGEGWSDDEEIQGATARWAVAQGAQFFLPSSPLGSTSGDGTASYELRVRLLPFDYPGADVQRVTLYANGEPLGTLQLSPGWAEYGWSVPSAVLRNGLNDLRFEFGRLDAPAEVLPGSGAIGSTGVQAPVAIEVNSGGPAGFAYITVEGEAGNEDGSLHSHGYNVAIIDARTGRLLQRQGFDTTSGGSQAQAAALVAFMDAIPAGRIVAVAMQGDGDANLTAEAVAALHAIGGEADPRGSDGWSHAIIGVKGAAPGTALEAAGPENGWVRAAPDRRTLAVAVDSLWWEQAQ
ncbi:MAG: hypothetical protein M8467_16045 [Anaerolineae bacterium]|nr:hypothetical protein [Anaerolineae bacterium]